MAVGLSPSNEQLKSMVSELSNQKFHTTLAKLTSSEKKLFLLTPYKFNGKPFCGTFNEKSFSLTRNTPWYHIKWLTIKGKYEPLNSGKTQVEFQVGNKNWKRTLLVVTIVLFVLTNTSVVLIATNHYKQLLIPTNLLVLAAMTYVFLLNIFSRFVVSQRFKQEFQIDRKPTDSNGYSE